MAELTAWHIENMPWIATRLKRQSSKRLSRLLLLLTQLQLTIWLAFYLQSATFCTGLSRGNMWLNQSRGIHEWPPVSGKNRGIHKIFQACECPPVSDYYRVSFETWRHLQTSQSKLRLEAFTNILSLWTSPVSECSRVSGETGRCLQMPLSLNLDLKLEMCPVSNQTDCCLQRLLNLTFRLHI